MKTLRIIMPRMDPVFLLSPGRSGSTLLQRYLNCSPDLVMWGEHGGFIKGLTTTFNRWKNHPRFGLFLDQYRQHVNLLLESNPSIGVNIEWTNNFTTTDMLNAYTALVSKLFTKNVEPETRWGFKEIRYTKREIDFLKMLFPSASFVFIVREPISTLASSLIAWGKTGEFWNYTRVEYKKNLLTIEEEITNKAKHLNKIAQGINKSIKEGTGLLIKYEELTSNPFKIITDICLQLNITPVKSEKVLAVSSDKRAQSIDAKKVKSIIVDLHLQDKIIQRLLKTYQSFGYLY